MNPDRMQLHLKIECLLTCSSFVSPCRTAFDPRRAEEGFGIFLHEQYIRSSRYRFTWGPSAGPMPRCNERYPPFN